MGLLEAWAMERLLCRGGIDDQSSVDAGRIRRSNPMAVAQTVAAKKVIRGGESGILGGTQRQGAKDKMTERPSPYDLARNAKAAELRLRRELLTALQPQQETGGDPIDWPKEWNRLLLEIAKLDPEWADADESHMDEFDPWQTLRDLRQQLAAAQQSNWHNRRRADSAEGNLSRAEEQLAAKQAALVSLRGVVKSIVTIGRPEYVNCDDIGAKEEGWRVSKITLAQWKGLCANAVKALDAAKE